MITVAIVGPECTGKTTLAKALAAQLGVKWVPEFARSYLSSLDRKYQEEDLIDIAEGQLSCQQEAIDTSEELVIFDTDLLVIKIWSEYKYGRLHPTIQKQYQTNKPDLYLLTYTDIPYEEDPLREHNDQREDIFQVYEKELIRTNANFIVLKGDEKQRMEEALHKINMMR